MEKMNRGVLVSRIFGWLVAVLVLALAFILPSITAFYCEKRGLSQLQRLAVLIAYDICIPIILFALWKMDGLLVRIRLQQVFVQWNIRALQQVRWACAGVALVSLAAAVIVPPIAVMTVMMVFLWLIMGVLAQVLGAAVALREENELTI